MPDLRGRDAFEREIARQFQQVGKRFVDDLLKALGNPPDVNNIKEKFWLRYGAALQQAIQPTLEAIYLESVKQVLSEAPLGISWSLPNEAAARWAQQYSYKLVSQINETTKAKLQGYVSNYFRTQKTMGQLRAQIQPNIGDLLTRSGRLLTSEQRARLIATTEVTRASVQGELEIVSEIEADGFEMVAVWQTNNDDLVCPLCGPRNGKRQGDGWDEPPPGHPGCRCWLNHTLDKGSGAKKTQPTPAPQVEQAAQQGTPVSNALQIPSGKRMKPLRDAVQAIDKVHADGQLEKIPVRADRSKTRFGAYWPDRSGKAVKITVDPNSEHPRMTMAHEAGHFLDHQGIGKSGVWSSVHDQNMAAWMKAIEKSKAVQNLQAIKPGTVVNVVTEDGRSMTYHYDRRYLNYLQQPEELWARSYAQYIATRSGDRDMLHELNAMRNKQKSRLQTQWADDDFEPIAKEIDALFAQQGWR